MAVLMMISARFASALNKQNDLLKLVEFLGKI
jgi:hypothetical protein